MLRTIKNIGRNVLCAVLERQVATLRKRNDIKIIAVVGSLGKTSTKRAIVSVLGTQYRVQSQAGNYNVRLTVPLVFFGQAEPAIFNIPAWLKLLAQNQRILKQSYPFEYVVLELGTDAPGQIAEFAYLYPDLTVVTAVADEHMEYFKTIDAVAAEELKVFDYSQSVLVNADLVDEKYLDKRNYTSYGRKAASDYQIVDSQTNGLVMQTVTVKHNDLTAVFDTAIAGEQGASITTGALAIAVEQGMNLAAAAAAVKAITAVPGRMQVLAGIAQSQILDDTYNASPVAVQAGLDVLYKAEATQRVAILGDMNELGDTSNESHAAIGTYCDPAKLDLVVTIGNQSKAYLAPAAKARGCQVVSFLSPYEAGNYIKTIMQPGAVILAKGSQNGVFAEEAVKLLLADEHDVRKLVRQSDYWLQRKRRQFNA